MKPLKRLTALLLAALLLPGAAPAAAAPVVARASEVAQAALTPGAPAISPGPTTEATTLVLTWSTPVELQAAYYEVYRGKQADFAADEATYIGRTQANETWFINTVPGPGTYYFRVTAVTETGYVSAPGPASKVVVTGEPAPDVIPPAAPTNLKVTALADTAQGVQLTWNHADEADVDVYLIYRQRGRQNFTPSKENFLAYAESREFVDILPKDAPYAYRVVAQDEAGNLSQPSGYVVADLSGPAIEITQPADGAAYPRQGSLTPTVSVSHPSGIVETKYYLDGKVLSGAINLAQLSLGSHTFRVEATNQVGNTTIEAVTFKVVEPTKVGPQITIKSPKKTTYEGEGSLTVDVEVEGASKTAYYLDGKALSGSRIDLANLASGEHTFKVVAEDRHGYKNEAQVTFRVTRTQDKVAPVIVIKKPVQDATYKEGSSLKPEIKVTDNDAGVAWVKWYLDGNEVKVDQELKKLKKGSHLFTVEAADKAGNRARASVSFQVGKRENEKANVDGLRKELADQLSELKDGQLREALAKLIKDRQYLNFIVHVEVFEKLGWIDDDLADELLATAYRLTTLDPKASSKIEFKLKLKEKKNEKKPKQNPGKKKGKHKGRGWGWGHYK